MTDADTIADLEATIQWVEEFASGLPKKERAILRSIIRVRPAARAVLPEYPDIDAVRAALRRLQSMGERGL
jgi:hypothetical protein